MKKYILLLLSIFVFVPTVYANTKIKNIDISIEIDDNGVAKVTEKWDCIKQDAGIYEKVFSNTKNSKISKIKIVDGKENIFESTNKLSKRHSYKYSLKKKENLEELYFSVPNENNIYTISYKIDNFITKFKDNKLGIDYVLFNNQEDYEIGSINIYINSKHYFSDLNTSLLSITKKTNFSFEEGKIKIVQSDYNNNSSIRLVAIFNNIEFKKYYQSEFTSEETLKTINKENKEMANIIKMEAIIILISLILLMLIIYLTSLRLIRNKKNKLNINIDKKDDIKYYDTIPCNGKLFNLYYLGLESNLVKNKSNLIGAILFKWLCLGIIKLEYDNEEPYLYILPNIEFKGNIEINLYKILLNVSTIKGNKLIRYAKNNNKEIINWFNLIDQTVILDEVNNKNIKEIKKKKKAKLIPNESYINEIYKAQGLKKYLLHFNQVPRNTELTEELYLNLLVVSIMFGIEEQVVSEILRKNSDNLLALKLKEFLKLKDTYYNIYKIAYNEYKEDNKKSKKKGK